MSTTGTEKMSYEDYLKTVKTAADTAYTNAETAAQGTFQSALNTANANYNKAKAEYGANAEALGGMGLRGSGYSDYLNSQAFAQKQSAYNNANFSYQAALADAEARRDATKLEADGLMAQYLQQQEADKLAYQRQQEANKLTAYETLLTNAGTYDLDTLTALMDSRGLDNAQRLNVYNAAFGSGSYTIPQLDALAAKYSTNADLISAITAAKESILKNGSFSDTLYFDSEGKSLPHSDARTVLDNIKTTYGESIDANSPYQNALSQFNNLYGVTAPSKKIIYSGGDVNGSPEAGDNIRVKDKDGNTYRVEFAGKSSNDAYKAAKSGSNDIEDGQVFKYGSDYYIIYQGTAHKIQKRTGSDGSSFEAMVKAFDGED